MAEASEDLITIHETVVVDPLTRERTKMYVANGPDGIDWILKRSSPEAAKREGLSYLRAHYKPDAHGRWVLK